ncbi:sodium/potassium-transporting ATPase subunit beta-3-like isoform X2 [Convolutriloba macropyga]|uniref:sodium/potassium-transporting ATPase subunit beta-3-like isoform X1 n=1 Tax=Convolutriloba macropyga TaxID=536237 RepID=UPI003F51F9BF
MGKGSDEQEQSGFAGKLAQFRLFLWNKETKEVAGRTARSWIEITIFFIVLYAALAAFWVGLLYLVQLRLPDIQSGPLYTDYLTHRGPGVHLIPKPEVVGRDKQKIFKMENVDSYFEEVEAFLSNHTQGNNLGDCSLNSFRNQWNSKAFCFYLYMNAVHEFVPKPLDGSVSLKCGSSKKWYDQFLEGEPTYYPSGGFDQSKFPWTYGMDWDSSAPIVAAKVKFSSKLDDDAEGRLNCRVVASNVHIDLEKPNIGMVDFRIRAA